MTHEPDYRQILLNMLAGLSLADHLGDVATDALEAADLAGFLDGVATDEDLGDLEDLTRVLVRDHKATTVFGTSLEREEYT